MRDDENTLLLRRFKLRRRHLPTHTKTGTRPRIEFAPQQTLVTTTFGVELALTRQMKFPTITRTIMAEGKIAFQLKLSNAYLAIVLRNVITATVIVSRA